MSKYPIIEEDFLEVFGKTSKELRTEWVELKNSIPGQQPNNVKRKFFHQYVKELNFENLMKYYNSYEFSLMVASYLHDIDGYLKDIDTCLQVKHESCLRNSMAFTLFPNIGQDRSKTRILDYGCGSHLTTLIPASFGFDVTFADIPHKAFQVIKKMVGRYFPKVKFIDIVNDSSVIQEYDLIYCNEVLEHVFEPEDILQHLVDHLKSGGWMWLSTFFDDMRGEDPSHLKRNTERYNNPDTWNSIVEKHGLKPLLYTAISGVIKGWHKP